jgi:CheY-like chemotaxis protein
MAQKILWLDNDRGLSGPYVDFLRESGYEVQPFETAAEAEEALSREHYDLILLDVMIPTLSDEEERAYPPDETQLGYRTGLIFWKRNKSKLAERGVPVLVFTVRLDEGIKEEFKAAGLPDASFANKMEIGEPAPFLSKIRSLILTP